MPSIALAHPVMHEHLECGSLLCPFIAVCLSIDLAQSASLLARSKEKRLIFGATQESTALFL
jgi:hypothetical protein